VWLRAGLRLVRQLGGALCLLLAPACGGEPTTPYYSRRMHSDAGDVGG
jgi:hypothetical protein